MNKLYTAQEIADKLKIKKTTVYELIKRGELESSKIGKQLRISEEQLNRYLQGGDPPVPEAPLPFPDFQPESSLLKRDYLLYSNGLIISGQASPALVPGMSVAAFVLYEYFLGFYVKKGNPKNILSVSDLKRSDVALANREKGSTGRMYLDLLLKEAAVSSSEIRGYQKELVSDFSTANAVLTSQADAALGAESLIFKSKDLDFIPLQQLPMFLVMETESMNRPGFSALAEIIRSPEFCTALRLQNGCNTARTGEILYL